MSSLQVGGGEIAQALWFGLVGLGVQSSSVMGPLIGSIGEGIQHPERRLTLQIKALVTLQEKGHIADRSKETEDAFNALYDTGFERINLFLTTNMRSLLDTQQAFELGFNGSSLLVKT